MEGEGKIEDYQEREQMVGLIYTNIYTHMCMYMYSIRVRTWFFWRASLNQSDAS